MKISYRWLSDYIQTDLTPQQMAIIFTSIGLEVESLEESCPIKGGLEGFVIGEVLTCEKHPNADKLSVTTVNTGEGRVLGIVCGAPNVAAGQKVVVATVGTTIYQGNDHFQIKRAKIRGIESEGMICAEDEIGIGHSHEGILVLDPIAVIGTPAKQYFNIEVDYIFEIGLTPNRIDAVSHIGVARDLAAYLSVNIPGFFKEKSFSIPDVVAFHADNHQLPIGVTVENTEACPRYSGLTISGVSVAPSPVWLQNRLRAIGLTPINNVVDITNYVLHETAQPLHAFDADRITENRVVVKTLPEGTAFVTLDGVERKLAHDDLMICNTQSGMCIGGVFGGKESGISDQTTNIFLESAYFNPVYIRRTAKRHGLNTDASFRFERGIDPESTVYVLKRAALLIKEIAGGQISSDIVDVYPNPVNPFRIELSFHHINRLAGQDIPSVTIKKIVESLDIKIESCADDRMIVCVPPYRVDVQREADIAEEILRIYGYNNIRLNEELHSTLSYSAKPDREKIVNLISDFLSSCGFNEIMSNSLTKSSYYQHLESFAASRCVNILNPLSQDLGCMRQTLLFGGLEAIIYNMNRKNHDLKLYEFGNCYHLESDRSNQALNGYTEQYHLAMFICGDKYVPNWNTPGQSVSFYTLKGYADNVFKRLGISPEALQTSELHNDIFHEGLIYGDGKIPLAEIGIVQSSILKEFDIKAPVYYANFWWDPVVQKANRVKIKFTDIPKFPEVRRDLSLLVNKNTRFTEICEIASRTERKLLKSVNLFDVYEGDKIEKDKKSYAVSFCLQDEEHTLMDKQIDKTMQRIANALEKEVGAQIRQ